MRSAPNKIVSFFFLREEDYLTGSSIQAGINTVQSSNSCTQTNNMKVFLAILVLCSGVQSSLAHQISECSVFALLLRVGSVDS